MSNSGGVFLKKLKYLAFIFALFIILTGCSNVDNVNDLADYETDNKVAASNHKEDKDVIIYKPEDSAKRERLFGSRIGKKDRKNLKGLDGENDVSIVVSLYINHPKYIQFINEAISNYAFNVKGQVQVVNYTHPYGMPPNTLHYVINVPENSNFIDDFSPQTEQYLVDQGVELTYQRRAKFITN